MMNNLNGTCLPATEVALTGLSLISLHVAHLFNYFNVSN